MAADQVVIGRIETPIGPFGAVLTPRGLARLTAPAEPVTLCEAWVKRWMPQATLTEAGEQLEPVARQLRAYLQGEQQGFTFDLDLRGTPFQQQVWAALRQIPFGETRTYTNLAAALGRPKAVRAVGRANATNPVAIIVPCHRLVGSDGALTGYAGGLPMKRLLLELEGVKLLDDRAAPAL